MITWLIVAGAWRPLPGRALRARQKSFKPFTYFQLAAADLCQRQSWAGLGNPLGAIAGGFTIAFSEVMITYAWKKVAGLHALPEALEPPTGLAQLLSHRLQVRSQFRDLADRASFQAPRAFSAGKSV